MQIHVLEVKFKRLKPSCAFVHIDLTINSFSSLHVQLRAFPTFLQKGTNLRSFSLLVVMTNPLQYLQDRDSSG